MTRWTYARAHLRINSFFLKHKREIMGEGGLHAQDYSSTGSNISLGCPVNTINQNCYIQILAFREDTKTIRVILVVEPLRSGYPPPSPRPSYFFVHFSTGWNSVFWLSGSVELPHPPLLVVLPLYKNFFVCVFWEKNPIYGPYRVRNHIKII